MATLIKNGNNYASAQQEWQVADAAELSTIAAASAGSIAYTAGFKRIWVMSGDGEWVQL